MFAMGGVGFAGITSKGEEDFRLLLQSPEAAKAFDDLYAHGNGPGKAYALLGLVAALFGILIMRLVTFAEIRVQGWQRIAGWRPLIGGLLLIPLALVSPQTLSAGHGALHLDLLLRPALSFLAIVLLLRLSPSLDALALGEEVAQSLGHDLRSVRLQVICLSAFGVGACVAICGAIGFIGLVAPIFARRLTGGHPGRAILPAALIGAGLLTIADLTVRIAPLGRTLPIGVATALVGAPFFLWLVAHMRWRLRP